LIDGQEEKEAKKYNQVQIRDIEKDFFRLKDLKRHAQKPKWGETE